MSSVTDDACAQSIGDDDLENIVSDHMGVITDPLPVINYPAASFES